MHLATVAAMGCAPACDCQGIQQTTQSAPSEIKTIPPAPISDKPSSRSNAADASRVLESPSATASPSHWLDSVEQWVSQDCSAFGTTASYDEGSSDALSKEHLARLSEACELELDLDGDNLLDRVFKVRDQENERSGFAVLWGNNRQSLLGAGRAVVVVGGDEESRETWKHDTYSWVAHWEPIPYVRGAFQVPILRKVTRVSIPDAQGDGILLSSTDAAVLYYFDGESWRWYDLGF